MKKFKNVESFNKYLEKEFDMGFDEGIEDVKEFVGDDEFKIDFDSEEEMIIEIRGKRYFIVERYEEVKFVEVK